MKKTKCPECGHIQKKQKSNPDLKTKLFMDFFESQGTKFIHHIQCEKCEVSFPQDEYEIENPTNTIAQEFVDKYFNADTEDEEDKTILTEDDWIDEESGIVDIHGYIFYIGFIKKALELNATRDQVLDFYDYQLECYQKKKEMMTFEEFVNEKGK